MVVLMVTIFHVLIQKPGQKFFAPVYSHWFSAARRCAGDLLTSEQHDVSILAPHEGFRPLLSLAPAGVSHSVSGLKNQTPRETQVKATGLLILHRNCNCGIVVIKLSINI